MQRRIPSGGSRRHGGPIGVGTVQPATRVDCRLNNTLVTAAVATFAFLLVAVRLLCVQLCKVSSLHTAGFTTVPRILRWHLTEGWIEAISVDLLIAMITQNQQIGIKFSKAFLAANRPFNTEH